MYTAIITASTGKNIILASRIESALHGHQHTVKALNIASPAIPVYTTESENAITENPAVALYTLMKGASGLVIVSPEYNYTMPPVLTSALCWASRINSDFRACFQDKPMILASFSYSGSQNLLIGLRTMMMNLGSIVMGQALLDTPQNPLSDEAIQHVTQRFTQLLP